MAVMPYPLLATQIVCGLDFYLTGLKTAGFYLYLFFVKGPLYAE